ncbi:MAG: class I mannose-6-phosphate isomerase [Bacteroidales bacterium]|nr:class I mannose-6-phosphate isomerase [Bacteroidales bacterium]MDG1902277.1 class I mannose-6-phosphate isomerase [Bacteroidales bacterium]MDG2081257.1 class I mannose-6-phosphate isomerase [Bacteroidales bacterium]
MRPSNDECLVGWESIVSKLRHDIEGKKKFTILMECNQGVLEQEIADEIKKGLQPDNFYYSSDIFLSEGRIKELTAQDVTTDRVFGYITRLTLDSFIDSEKLAKARNEIESRTEGLTIALGSGASYLIENPDCYIYLDMARWEIQMRMRRNEVNNLGIINIDEGIESKYKRAYFVDWRVLDRFKKTQFNRWDYVLDTNNMLEPKMITGNLFREGINLAAHQPFSLVPYFDAGPWGGQWMKEVCDLDKETDNYAWCFNCVPEENSLYLKFGNINFETPSVNVVYYRPVELLGEAVYGRFGDEFPIRFDFLDTMDGGNLSLQVHPVTEYIQQKFGMNYTQDESYYLLDAGDDAVVYLGLKEGINSEGMIDDLRHSKETGERFPTEKYVMKWPAKKHDHFLIPAGTVHCSGKNSMVLEISSTPYIFTFKLWDWERLGMDGKPRPINIEHGKNVINWERTESYTKENLINQIEPIEFGDGWKSEKTGLHESEFIETRRHWFIKPVIHKQKSGVRVFNVIEGREIIVKSLENNFAPKVFHYAETFILPASAGDIIIEPYGESKGKECGTILAYVRTNK